MEEDIENVKFIIRNLRAQYYNERFVSSLENVLSRLKQLEEERNTYRRQLNDVFSRGFIHKDKIKEQIEWLDNDIKNTKRKIAEEQIYYDDIRKVRLKTYCTKSNEIKNRLKKLLGEE